MEGGSSPCSRRRKLASLVIFDTEAAGSAINPRKRLKITELCLLCIQTDEIATKKTPRVINKLQLCLNPECNIPPQINSITGLFNDHLEHMPIFRDVASLITSFLANQPKPLCIVAHNGNGFDFPLLLAELQAAGETLPEDPDILCADSLEAFRMMDGLPPVPEWVLKREAEQRKRAATGTGVQVVNGKEDDVTSGTNQCVTGSSERTTSDTLISTSGREGIISSSGTKEDITGSSEITVSNPLPSTSNLLLSCEVSSTSATSGGNTANACNQIVCETGDINTNKNMGQKRSQAEGTSTSATEKDPELPGNAPQMQPGTEQTEEITSSTAPKVPRLEEVASALDVSSQLGATDSQLTEAYSLSSQPSITDSQLNEALQNNGYIPTVAPHGREEAHSATVSLQRASDEVTPPRSTGLSAAVNVAAQFIKRGQPVYVTEERQKASRRLFIDDSGNHSAISEDGSNECSSVVGPTMSTVGPTTEECSDSHSTNCKGDSSQKVSMQPSATPAVPAGVTADCHGTRVPHSFNDLSSQGSIPHEDFLSLAHELESETGVIPLRPENMVSLEPENRSSREGDNSSANAAPENSSHGFNSHESTSATTDVSLICITTAASAATAVTSGMDTSTSTAAVTSAVSPNKQDIQQKQAASSSKHSAGNREVKTNGASNQTAKPPQVSYKLVEIHRRMYGHLPAVAHTAEDDCKTLLRIILGRSEEFLEWANEHAVPLHSVKPDVKFLSVG